MEICVAFSDEPTMTDTLKITKKLGIGKFCVFEAYSITHKRSYALKIFPNNPLGTAQFHKEKLIYPLNHPNIIKSEPIQCYDKRIHCLLTEIAKYGSFFEITNNKHLDSQILIRTYFHQLVIGIEYIHSQGLAHLDLKLENLMLGADFQLRIIDFDQSQPISDPFVTSMGTMNYRAPEIKRERCLDSCAADIYSAGIILFAFISQEFPFIEQKCNEKSFMTYESFIENNKEFWKKEEKA